MYGGFSSLDSLSSYDKGKKSHEGRRYQKDIKSANEALDCLEQGFRNIRGYAPKKKIMWGNHEYRIDRAAELNAELAGTISKDDINFKQHGWETHEFMDVAVVDGIHYSHYFTTGVSGKPIGGENPASSILKKHYVSCVAAHSHIYDYAERAKPDGTKINGLVAGCYCDHPMPYAKGTEHMWWAGITILDEVKNGDYDLRRISLKRILRDYL